VGSVERQETQGRPESDMARRHVRPPRRGETAVLVPPPTCSPAVGGITKYQAFEGIRRRLSGVRWLSHSLRTTSTTQPGPHGLRKADDCHVPADA
jgi:hypothetical protein